MRLGLVLTGEGACAACGAGVLRELWRRGLEPGAVCGMQAGAWSAALFCSGLQAKGLKQAAEQAQRMGRKLISNGLFPRHQVIHGGQGLCGGGAIQRLLRAQAGERIMALSPRQGIFLCRTARGGRRVIFSTQAYVQERGASLVTQISLSFAARAAMSTPPFLQPVTWLGSPLLPETDVAFACRQLMAMGMQRVLVVAPQLSPQHEMDALDLAAACRHWPDAEVLPENTALLRVLMPTQAGALAVGSILQCMQAGECAAQTELDRMLEGLGMAHCRVLPFRRSI